MPEVISENARREWHVLGVVSLHSFGVYLARIRGSSGVVYRGLQPSDVSLGLELFKSTASLIRVSS
jgi:hypothetical protein